MLKQSNQLFSKNKSLVSKMLKQDIPCYTYNVNNPDNFGSYPDLYTPSSPRMTISVVSCE